MTAKGCGAEVTATGGRVVLDVCVSCESAQGAVGRRLYDSLRAACADEPSVSVRAVDCLAVCERPVVVAFRALGRWSYMIGDTSADEAVDDSIEAVMTAARAVARAPHGVPAMEERPAFFRKGVICRLPPEPVARG